MKTEYNGLVISGTPGEMVEFAQLLKPQEKPTEPKPAPDPTKKKDIDMGKVKALRKAGWAYAKIADEMGVSTQTIVNRLKEG